MSEKIKLELGTGNNFRQLNGYKTIGVDIMQPETVPEGCLFFKCNLGFENIPVSDNSIDLVQVIDVLEHIDRVAYVYIEYDLIEVTRLTPFIHLMNEIYRVCKDGAEFISETPFSTEGFYRDPTHVNRLSSDWHHYFSSSDNLYYDQGLIKCNFKLKNQSFRKYKWTDKDIMRTELIAIKSEFSINVQKPLI